MIKVIVILFIIVSVYYVLTKKSGVSSLPNPFSKSKKEYTIDDEFNAKKVAKQYELDTLLDKVSKKGYDRLSKKEKHRLEELSK